eukprot:8557616-Lingulodinium_polyedra.AAC.1
MPSPPACRCRRPQGCRPRQHGQLARGSAAPSRWSGRRGSSRDVSPGPPWHRAAPPPATGGAPGHRWPASPLAER